MNLTMLRKQAGVTQKDIAQALGVAQSTVAMWEARHNLPRASMLPALASILKCSIDALFEDDAHPTLAKEA